VRFSDVIVVAPPRQLHYTLVYKARTRAEAEPPAARAPPGATEKGWCCVDCGNLGEEPAMSAESVAAVPKSVPVGPDLVVHDI